VDPGAERRLARRAQKGNWRAFDKLFRAHWERSYRVTCLLCDDPALVSDLLKHAWVQAYEGLEGYSGRKTFWLWFCRILFNVLSDHQRYLHASQPDEASVVATIKEAAGENQEPERLLRLALQAVPLAQRRALVLVAFDRLSYAEAAEIESCPLGTLAWRVTAGRSHMVELLTEHITPEKAQGR